MPWYHAVAASVGLLQLRFLAEHQQHVLATLELQQEVEQLASRDSLTGLAAKARVARKDVHCWLTGAPDASFLSVLQPAQ